MLPKDFKIAINIAEEVFHRLKFFLKPGLTEKEVAQKIRFYLRRHGAKKESFRIIVASGKRSALVHGFASNKKIRRDDIVMLDFGALYKGYRSDITRTYVMGKPTKKQRKIYSILLKAQRMAINSIKAGVMAKDVDRAARAVIEKAGFGRHFMHSTGHGICRKTHEPPRLHHKSKRKLEAGKVVTVEPGIYIKGWGGMRVEDMVLITRAGCKLLTKIPYHLQLT